MAGLSYNITDSEVVTVWERELDREIRVRDPLLDPEEGLAGDTLDSLIVMRDELNKQGGATLRLKMKYQLEGQGRAKDQQLKGHEEAYQTATFDVNVDTLRHAVGVASPITQQWVPEDTFEESKDSLADWYAKRLPLGLHLHATGASFITNNQFTLNNTINAVNSNYILRPNSKTAGNLTSSDKFDLDLINKATMYLKLLRPKIRPAMTKWGPKYCCFLAPEQVKNLRDTDSVWYSNMVAAAQGGRIDDNGIWTRALGESNGVVFFESDLVPPGHNSGGTTFLDKTRRAWIGGAGALTLLFGRGWAAPGYDINRFQWTRETEDYNHQQFVAATSILGAGRPRYTKPTESSAREAGVLVLETYADYGDLSSSDVYIDWTQAGGTIS